MRMWTAQACATWQAGFGVFRGCALAVVPREFRKRLIGELSADFGLGGSDRSHYNTMQILRKVNPLRKLGSLP